MEKMFLDFVNVSVSSVWLVIAVLLLRLILKKAPKSIICALWAVVGLRLILPFNIESPVSLVPSAEVFPEEFLYAAEPKIDTGFEALDNVLNPVIAETLAPSPSASANPTQLNSFVFAIIWLAGMGVMLLYMLASFLRVRYKVREAAPLYENIWACDHIDTPFILGVIRPKIYVPSDMTAQDSVYVLAHEKAHIKRLDYIWKPLGFLILALHWFNPVVWVAYVLFCRDIEFACDEKVIGLLGSEKKREYSTALLNLSAPKHIISACPLAFGENGVKARIKGVLNYKKPAFWVILAAVVLAVAAVVTFFAGPVEKNNDDVLNSDVLNSLNTKYTNNNLRADTIKDSIIYDNIMFDIDGDGEEELCKLSNGPTFGMYTITLEVKKGSTAETNYFYYGYYYYIYHNVGDFEFDVKKGNLCIKHTEITGKINIFDVAYDGTNILLFENGEQLDMQNLTP